MPQRVDGLSDTEKLQIFEFYGLYSGRQWFDKAEIYTHPNQLKRTLELTCNYNPLLEMKEILTFTSKYNLAVEIVDLSNSDRANR